MSVLGWLSVVTSYLDSRKKRRVGDYKREDCIGYFEDHSLTYVWKHCKTGQQVIGKEINRKTLRKNEQVSKDLETLQELDHPNLIKYLEVVEKDSFIHVFTQAMEMSVDTMMKISRFTEPDCQKYGRDIMTALKELHDNDIVHGAVTADNVFIDQYNVAKLACVSFSKYYPDKTPEHNNGILVHGNYLSVETLIYGRVQKNSDVWSAGCVIYAMVEQHPPFGRSDISVNELRIKTEKMEQLSLVEISTGMSDQMKAFLHQIFVEADNRMSAEDALEHLWLTDEEVHPGETFQRCDRIGEGAYGEVHAWKSERTERSFAGKSAKKGNEEQSNAINREIEVLKNSNHANILKFITTFDYKGKCIVMLTELLQGSILDKLANAAIPESESCGYTRDILRGLDYLHSKDVPIIHRDIKGSNVFLDRYGRVKLGDLGLSRSQVKISTSSKNNPKGTMLYMSPEVMENKVPTGQSDVWSAGITLFEMLSQKPPFADDSMTDVVSKTKALRQRREVGSINASKDAKNFLLHILVAVRRRPSAKVALSHPWLAFKIKREVV